MSDEGAPEWSSPGDPIRPDRAYRAYIGVGPMVDPSENDGVFNRDTLAWAPRTRNTSLVAKPTASGPPPYTDMLDCRVDAD